MHLEQNCVFSETSNKFQKSTSYRGKVISEIKSRLKTYANVRGQPAAKKAAPSELRAALQGRGFNSRILAPRGHC